MKVFVTGATGFIGSAIVHELLTNGHQVLGLARSDEAAASLTSVGADVQRGTLDDAGSLRSGASASDAVIHTAFIHDFSDYARAAQTDQRAIETIGSALVGSNRPFIVTDGLSGLVQGRLGTGEDARNSGVGRLSEETALSLVPQGVRVSIIRLPASVHGEGDHGFVPSLIQIARTRSMSAYPGDGANRWSGVHRLDAAHLYRLALETAPAGSRLHGVADKGIPVRDIAEVIGRRLNIPVVSVPIEEASEHFGWLGRFFSMDFAASSTLTQQRFGWHPVQLGLLADLDHDYYFNHEM